MSAAIKWDAAKEDHRLLGKIAKRAVEMARESGIEYRFSDAVMDVTACHANGTPLRLTALLEADDFNFSHDVFGIRRYLDRETGALTDCFVPRFAVHQ